MIDYDKIKILDELARKSKQEVCINIRIGEINNDSFNLYENNQWFSYHIDVLIEKLINFIEAEELND